MFTELRHAPLLVPQCVRGGWRAFGLMWGKKLQRKKKKWGRPSLVGRTRTWADEKPNTIVIMKKSFSIVRRTGNVAIWAFSLCEWERNPKWILGKTLGVERYTASSRECGTQRCWANTGKSFLPIDSISQLHNCQPWGHRFYKLFHLQEKNTWEEFLFFPPRDLI